MEESFLVNKYRLIATVGCSDNETSIGEMMVNDNDLAPITMIVLGDDSGTLTLTHLDCNSTIVDSVVIYGIVKPPSVVWRSDGTDLTDNTAYDSDFQTLAMNKVGLDFCNSTLLNVNWK